jgi:methyl-accepting chemotaxis protein
MFRDIKIKTRILAVLGILGTGYLILLGAVQVTSSVTHRRMAHISASLFPAALRMQAAEAAFERMKKHYGDAVVLQDTSALAGADKDADTVAQALDDVKTAVAGTPGLAAQADALASQFSDLRSRDKLTYAQVVSSKDGPSDELMSSVAALGKDNTALSNGMSKLNESISKEFQAQLDEVDAYSLRSRIIGMVMLIFALAACTGAWWIVDHKVVLPLQSLAMRLQDIAEGEGDLTRRAETNGRDEIDEVATWFNVFIERIEEIVRSVAINARDLDQAASALTRSAQETAGQAEQEQVQAARISSTMSEISAAVRQISEMTQCAASDARKAEEIAHAGGQTTRTTVIAIEQLLEANRTTSLKIEELGHSSDAIGKVISVIGEIADQTNLLALNASIEAARAGEHGRGFAVVAGEVRRLAERTSSATKEIDSTVRAIQRGTGEVVRAMRSSMQQVQGGVDSAKSAGQSLASIIEGAESVQKSVTQIAAASTEQSYSMQSVDESVNQVARFIQVIAENSGQSLEACRKLSALASGLSRLVGAFKVSEQDDFQSEQDDSPGRSKAHSSHRELTAAALSPTAV